MARYVFWTMLCSILIAFVYVLGLYAASVITAPLTVTP